MSAATSPKRRRRPPEETRRLILDAATACLREAPYRDLSVDAVMARTGLTRTLFYRHFEGISQLMLALIAELGGELVTIAEAWADSQKVGPEESRARLASFVDFQTRNASLVRATVDAAHQDPDVEQAYEGMVEVFVTITEKAIAARVAPADEHMDSAEVARALVRMLNGYLADPRRTPDPERALEAAWTIWARTLFSSGLRY